MDIKTLQIDTRELKTRTHLILDKDQLQIWQADLDALDLGEDLLSLDERERAARFRFPHDRKHYATGRQLLRRLLGAYLGSGPARIRFVYSAEGKPFLDESSSAGEIRFNVSHSEKVALFAFVSRREVGVDVERIRNDFDVEEIAQRFFSGAERKALAELPDHLKPEAFFHCWTRKEAFVKAQGGGLSLPLDQFDVSVLPESGALLLGTRPDVEERHRWSMLKVDAGPGYAAAVTVEGAGLWF
jgi:4'-phosphopantetheinyl transferase